MPIHEGNLQMQRLREDHGPHCLLIQRVGRRQRPSDLDARSLGGVRGSQGSLCRAPAVVSQRPWHHRSCHPWGFPQTWALPVWARVLPARALPAEKVGWAAAPAPVDEAARAAAPGAVFFVVATEAASVQSLAATEKAVGAAEQKGCGPTSGRGGCYRRRMQAAGEGQGDRVG